MRRRRVRRQQVSAAAEPALCGEQDVSPDVAPAHAVLGGGNAGDRVAHDGVGVYAPEKCGVCDWMDATVWVSEDLDGCDDEVGEEEFGGGGKGVAGGEAD